MQVNTHDSKREESKEGLWKRLKGSIGLKSKNRPEDLAASEALSSCHSLPSLPSESSFQANPLSLRPSIRRKKEEKILHNVYSSNYEKGNMAWDLVFSGACVSVDDAMAQLSTPETGKMAEKGKVAPAGTNRIMVVTDAAEWRMQLMETRVTAQDLEALNEYKENERVKIVEFLQNRDESDEDSDSSSLLSYEEVSNRISELSFDHSEQGKDGKTDSAKIEFSGGSPIVTPSVGFSERPGSFRMRGDARKSLKAQRSTGNLVVKEHGVKSRSPLARRK